MGATLTVNNQTSEMIRLVGDELVRENQASNLYEVPPKGEYQFMITGYALPFEMPKAQEYGGGTQTMTRVEFTITEGKGKGRMFTQLWGYSIGPKSNLGKFLRRMNVDLTPDANGAWDLDRMIGYVGSGYITPSETIDDVTKRPKYANLSIDTVDGISAPKRAYSIAIDADDLAPKPVQNGHHATADDNDGWPDN